VVLGGFWGVRQFYFHGELIWGTVWVVLGSLGELGNFPLWGVDLGHCIGGFRWFWGSQAIFRYGELIWGTV
jgi:hypothetical protein